LTSDPKGGGCNIGWTQAGEWLEYDVSVSAAASFDLIARLASGTTGKTVHVEVDGKNVTGTMTSPSGGWQAFADVVTRNVPMTAGNHTLRLVMDTGSVNINYLDVQPSAAVPDAGPSPDACKRGIAYGQQSVADMQALSAGITWWYNWSQNPDAGVVNDYKRLGIEFVPMLWDERFDPTSSINGIPQGARTLLTFNEPNFFSQANLSPQQSADQWPRVEQIAKSRGLKIASPALNYCGGGCWETNPFTYFDKFFSACPNCEVDYLAVHWYACTVDALRNYVTQMKKYNRPIWLTEFACGDGDTSLANQKAYLQGAVQYLESEPAVARYAWFSGRTTAIPNVNLLAGSGVLTELGQMYMTQPRNPGCPK
jgi:hypothetical protein